MSAGREQIATVLHTEHGDDCDHDHGYDWQCRREADALAKVHSWSDLARVADRIDTYCMFCDGDRKIIRSPDGDWEHCFDSIHAAADQVRAVAVTAP